MAQELKHIGRVKATNKKCVVAYRTLPGDAYSCLIVPTENMPDIFHDALINLVEPWYRATSRSRPEQTPGQRAPATPSRATSPPASGPPRASRAGRVHRTCPRHQPLRVASRCSPVAPSRRASAWCV